MKKWKLAMAVMLLAAVDGYASDLNVVDCLLIKELIKNEYSERKPEVNDVAVYPTMTLPKNATPEQVAGVRRTDRKNQRREEEERKEMELRNEPVRRYNTDMAKKQLAARNIYDAGNCEANFAHIRLMVEEESKNVQPEDILPTKSQKEAP